jgi:hypothetical protein
MGYNFNPFTGNFDAVDSPDGVFESVEVDGDITLDDGGTYITTLQTVTPTANRTISFPDATGTIGLVAGSSGQLVYNNAGAYAGVSTMTFDGTSVTLAGRLINSYTSIASSPAKVFTGTWFTGGTSTTTKPHLLIEPAGATSTAWSTSGTGLGVNAASGFAGKLLDLQVNGTSQFSVDAAVGTGVLCVRLQASNRVDVTNLLLIGSSTILSPGQLALGTGGAADTIFARDAANTFAQRNAANAQTFRVYNTFTDASNYERGFLRWSSNVFEVGPEAAGTGTARPMRITAATLKLPNLPTYADNAAATTGGLVAGDVYKTATGELRITV